MAKDVVVNLRLEKEGMVRGLMDVKAGFDMVYQGAKKVGEVFNDLMQTGAKYQHLLEANTLGTAKAERATAGLIGKMDLLRFANMSTAFQLGFTEQSFADVAKAAAVVARKLGIDVTYAMESVTIGLARQSPKWLDNLGILVDANGAYRRLADSMGTTVGQLTEAQKRSAFMTEALGQLNRIAGESTMELKTAGDNWQRLGVMIEDAKTSLAGWFASSEGDRMRLEELSTAIETLGDAFRLLSGNLDLSVQSLLRFAAAASFLPGAGEKFSDALKSIAWAKTLRPDLFEKSKPLAGGWWEEESAAPGAAGKGKGAGASAGVGPYGLGGWRSPSGWGQLASMEGKISEKEALDAATERQRAERAEVERLVDAWEKLSSTKTEVQDADLAFVEAQEKKIAAVRELNAELKNIALGGLADFAGGIWQAADAAIMGQESFGMAVAKMLKSTLLGIAAESTVRAVLETAMGFAALARYDFGAATNHFTSAGIFAGLAATAGGIGLGVSAGIGAAGGYDTKRSGSSRGAGSSAGQYRPSYGQRQEAQKQPIIVNVYYNGSDLDPGAALIATAKVQAVMAKAA